MIDREGARRRSYFDGGLFKLLVLNILGFLLTLISLGLA